MSRLLRRLRRGILSRDAVEVVGLALMAAAFHEVLGVGAGLFAASGGLLFLAWFGGRR